MQTKYLCVLIHIWNKVEVGAVKTGLSPPVKYFTDRSKAVLLLWMFYVFVLSCVCFVFVRVCFYVLCGHLLGKGWPLGTRLWCLTVSLSLSHGYPGSGVVLHCVDSWSLHPYLLRGCEGWSAPLLLAHPEDKVSRVEVQLYAMSQIDTIAMIHT